MFQPSTKLFIALALAAGAMKPLSAQKPALKAATPVAQDEVLAWPSPPAPARIKWVAEYRNAFDVGAKKKRSFLDRLAGKSEDVIWLQRPLSVAVDDKGVIFVGDYNLGVIAMDPANKKIWAFSAVSGSVLTTPTGLAADSKFVFATSANTSQVVIFDKEGRQLSALGKADGIKRPVGLAVDEARNLLVVVNGDEHAVRLYNRSLKLLKTIGSRGSEEGQFNFPTYVCMVSGVGFAVVDSGNFRVQLFDFNGRFLRAFGQVGVRRGQFQVPNGIAIDASGAIYVADQINHRIQKFQYLREEKEAPASHPTPQ